MNIMRHMIVPLLFLFFLSLSCDSPPQKIAPLARTDSVPFSKASHNAVKERAKGLNQTLNEHGLRLGAPLFIRIFKEESELEIWIENNDKKFTHFRSWDICAWSGELGPKLKEGDKQSPEGFYYVTPSRMNPHSNYHLAFDIGYPNSYDRHYQRTGSAIMVHGICGSLGCYAMTNPVMEEIWTLTDAALASGQPFFRVHIFPFRMSEENMERHHNAEWRKFWENLREGYDFFEREKRPPNVSVSDGKYVFD